MYRKIKDENASIKSTRQMRAQVDATQRKTTKANNQQKKKRKPYADMTPGYEVMINDNKEYLR